MVGRLDIGKLETTPVDFSELSNVVKNDVVKKSVYDKLVKKVNAIDSNKQILEKKIEDVNKKIPDTSKFIQTHKVNRLKETSFNTWTAEVEPSRYWKSRYWKQADNAEKKIFLLV